MVNHRIEHIDNEYIRLSNECTNSNIFLNHLKQLMANVTDDNHSYVEDNYHIDEIIILYKYLYNHIHYLMNIKGIEIISYILKFSRKMLDIISDLNKLHDLDHNNVDDNKCPSDLRDMAFKLIMDTVDKISNSLSELIN